MTYSPHYLPSCKGFGVNASENYKLCAFDHCT